MDTYSGITRCNDCPFIDRTDSHEWGDYGCSVGDEVSDEMKSAEVEAGVPPECPLHDGPITVALLRTKTPKDA